MEGGPTSQSRHDRDLEQTGGPAALESAAAAIAGVIVHGDVQYIVAGFAERNVRRRLPAKRNLLIARYRQPFDTGPRFVERHGAGPPVSRPDQRHRWTWLGHRRVGIARVLH